MRILNSPNLLSLLILGFVVLVAGTYGYVTYTQRPEMEHYAVDPGYGFPFDFEEPEQVVDLPEALTEISGLSSWYTDDQVLAVQDEDGELFVVDVRTGEIEETFSFGKNRDYEGVARNGDKIYVLESDGKVHYLDYVEGTKEYKAVKLETSFSSRDDTEGLAYDPVLNRLLITPKEQELTTDDEADDHQRGIYAYDPELGLMAPEPLFTIDEYAVGQVVYGQRQRFNIKPSGIAVDPITKDLYVLASIGNILVVIDRESNIKHIELLREKMFRQPEGLTFNARGDLFISSEGRGGDGVLATYRRQTAAATSKGQ
ncbi:SdiA-regulated domain-containing protein [Neolewinella lacunae]|uniref:Uncharacterized protein n=1 Tax=Neolewinella lacunae TaxID=1517758 RepID=A0A923PKJ9_9BACT|nr:SdiA-regulated domain-containing protein [Neolewinella lacunae]MBC6992913.1 hypothetical protein [Neolewinella lacunae]MDN3633723.1 SdiA-regulated domain-containing protein [Neolewinella lacunae]